MILKIFSIHDSATEAFNTPFYMLTKSEAIRAFINLAREPDGNIGLHPQDFQLYYLGTFDNISGIHTPAHESLGSASALKSKENVVPMKEAQ